MLGHIFAKNVGAAFGSTGCAFFIVTIVVVAFPWYAKKSVHPGRHAQCVGAAVAPLPIAAAIIKEAKTALV